MTATRGETSFVNEPYITGGNPILSNDKPMFNDILGTTLGVKSDKYTPVKMTAFGETTDKSAMFTGKPYIGELGYAFLFRNYRADQGKWQTSDPLGYPDGWNNLAYCNNWVTEAIDWLGGDTISQVASYGTWSAWSEWYTIGLPNSITGIQVWQRNRKRTNILQDFDVNISYNTDNEGVMWANLGAGVIASAIGGMLAGPPQLDNIRCRNG